MRATHLLLISVCVCLTPSLLLAQEANHLRGMNLYENHCTKCHESRVHIRDDRKAKSLQEIRAYIQRWINVEQLDWTESEIDDVLQYLNTEYYKYSK